MAMRCKFFCCRIRFPDVAMDANSLLRFSDANGEVMDRSISPGSSCDFPNSIINVSTRVLAKREQEEAEFNSCRVTSLFNLPNQTLKCCTSKASENSIRSSVAGDTFPTNGHGKV